MQSDGGINYHQAPPWPCPLRPSAEVLRAANCYKTLGVYIVNSLSTVLHSLHSLYRDTSTTHWRLCAKYNFNVGLHINRKKKKNIVRRVFHPTRKLVRVSLLKCPSIPNSKFCTTYSSWRSESYKPPSCVFVL